MGYSPRSLVGLAPQVLLYLSLFLGGVKGQSACSLCSNASSTFNAAKPYPFPNQSPPPRWSNVTDLSCGGVNVALSAYDSSGGTCPDPNTFVAVSFDMPAYCECSNTKPPRLCGDLCPPGSVVPQPLKNIVVKPETGNLLTCGEIVTLVDYTKAEDVCIRQEVEFIFSCCLSDADAGSSNSTSPTTSSPASSPPGITVPTTSVPNAVTPTTVTPTSANSSNLPTAQPTSSPTTSIPSISSPTPEPPVTAGTPSASPTSAAPTTAIPTATAPTPASLTTGLPTSSAPTRGPPSKSPTSKPTNTNLTTGLPTSSAPTRGPPSKSPTSKPTNTNPTNGPGTPSSIPSQQTTTGMPSTPGPTVTSGKPSALPPTHSPTVRTPSGNATAPPTAPPPTPLATPTTGAPTNSTPTIQPGNSTKRPSEKPSPRPISTTPSSPGPIRPPSAQPSHPPTSNPTKAQPTTKKPTVTPGSPSATPTTGTPTTLPPTAARPTASPTVTGIDVAVNAMFRMYNTIGLTSVEASQPGNSLVLNTAWIDFVKMIVADLETQKTRHLRSGRRLEVTLIPNTTTLDGIMDVTCPANDPAIPKGSKCQNVLGKYGLTVADDEDPDAVQEEYTKETARGIDEGWLQESLFTTDPKSPFTVAGTAIDVGNAKEETTAWWWIPIVILSCVIGVVGIACLAFFLTRPKQPAKQPDEQQLSVRLIEEDERPPDSNTVNAERNIAGESNGRDDDCHDDEDNQTPSEPWREPDPTVTVCADYLSDHDDQESECGTEEGDELASLPNTLFHDDDYDDAQQSYCVSEMTSQVFDGPVDGDFENEATWGNNSENDLPKVDVNGDPPECSRSQSVDLGEDPPVGPTGKDPSVAPTSASLATGGNEVQQENDELASDADEGNDPNSELEEDLDHEGDLDGNDNDDESSHLGYSMSVSSRGMVDMLDDSTAGRSEDTDAILAKAARQLAGDMQT